MNCGYYLLVEMPMMRDSLLALKLTYFVAVAAVDDDDDDGDLLNELLAFAFSFPR